MTSSSSPNVPSLLRIALVASVLALVLGLILVHGYYHAIFHHVRQLTTETARATVAATTADERQTIALSAVDTTIEAYPLLRRERLTVSVIAATDDPSRYDVTVSYDASDDSIWSLGVLPVPTIRHSSTIRRGTSP